MLAGQKSYGNNGYQNFLFPLEIMWMTQGSYSHTYSHNGCYAMDFQGAQYDGNGNVERRYHCPYYAPFDCTCVKIWGSSSPMAVWQSDNPVNAIGYNLPIVCCIGFCHDNNINSIHVGDHKMQGDVIGHTGTYGAPGADHVHIEATLGPYNGYYQNSSNVWMLRDSTWLYNLMGVNDTDLYKDYYVNHQGTTVHYNWREFSDIGPTPPGPEPPEPEPRDKTKGFPWWLYWNKFRNDRQ